jgi:hypothetical protein
LRRDNREVVVAEQGEFDILDGLRGGRARLGEVVAAAITLILPSRRFWSMSLKAGWPPGPFA